MSSSGASRYRPTVTPEYAERLRQWHEAAYAGMERTERHVSYLGLELTVPPQVFAPTPMSDLLGNAVLAEAGPGDRVLDMGTGSGVNAILAATRGADVTGVDINGYAIEAARHNADRNGVPARTRFLVSDMFAAVDGVFDLIVIDPPFRWFAPRDLLESSMADENYEALTRFMTEVGGHLAPDGRILLFFGTSGDIGYLYQLIDAAGLRRETVASRDLVKDGLTVSYHTFRLTR